LASIFVFRNRLDQQQEGDRRHSGINAEIAATWWFSARLA
jgi:hypothetical protein